MRHQLTCGWAINGGWATKCCDLNEKVGGPQNVMSYGRELFLGGRMIFSKTTQNTKNREPRGFKKMYNSKTTV